MNVRGKALLVTGANRGIGQALVEEALRRGAGRVYAGTRGPLAHHDERVTPVVLDVTNPAQIRGGGRDASSPSTSSSTTPASRSTTTSAIGPCSKSTLPSTFSAPHDVTQAFLPLLSRSRGAIVNNVSMMAFAPLPLTPAYAISKAALFNMTQSLRGSAGPAGRPGARRADRPHRHRHDTRLRDPKGHGRIRRPRRSSTASRTATRTSSPTRSRRCWPTAGATVPPKRSSTSTRRSSTPHQSPHSPHHTT